MPEPDWSDSLLVFSVVSQWTRGVYRGNNIEVEKLIRQWLLLRTRTMETGEPMPPGTPSRKAQGPMVNVAGSGDPAKPVSPMMHPQSSDGAAAAAAAAEPAPHAELRREIFLYSKEHRITQHEIGTQICYSTAVVNLWMRAKYNGNVDKLAVALAHWIAVRRVGASTPTPTFQGHF